MGTTTAETIREATRIHLKDRNGLLFGQCVTAVGWVGGTVPELTEDDGIVELPTSDVAGAGFVVGAALAGRRPIYVVRYQGFMWYNAATIVNYAAKSKEMWGVPCPVFVRAIAMEGGIGPVATGSHHSMMLRMPGMPIAAPMTPKEWQHVWDYYLAHDYPVYCSEHRLSFPLNYEIPDRCGDLADVTIFAISAGRLNAVEAVDKLQYEDDIRCNLINVVWIKPFQICERVLKCMTDCVFNVVIDSDYAKGGAAQCLAHEIMLASGKPTYALGLDDRTAGFAPHLDNLTPSPAKIREFIKTTLARLRNG